MALPWDPVPCRAVRQAHPLPNRIPPQHWLYGVAEMHMHPWGARLPLSIRLLWGWACSLPAARLQQPGHQGHLPSQVAGEGSTQWHSGKAAELGWQCAQLGRQATALRWQRAQPCSTQSPLQWPKSKSWSRTGRGAAAQELGYLLLITSAQSVWSPGKEWCGGAGQERRRSQAPGRYTGQAHCSHSRGHGLGGPHLLPSSRSG